MGQNLCRDEMLEINLLNCTVEWTKIVELNHCFLIGFSEICHFVLKITLRPLRLCCLVLYMYVLCCAVLCKYLTLYSSRDCSPPGSSIYGNSPGKNPGMGYHAFLQGIFPTWGLNPGLLHCRWILFFFF